MAARSVHTAGVAPVLEHLDKGDPLIDDDRDATDQHRSLDAVLDDSWALLDADARDTALRLSQLPGDFDAELAGDLSQGVVEVREMVDGHVADEGAAYFVVAGATVQPAQKK